MSIQSDTGIWTIGDNWPWPQIKFTNYFILAFAQKADGKLGLYELTNENNIWKAVEKTTLGNASAIQSISIADFYTYYIVTVVRIVNDQPDKVFFHKNISTGDVALTDPSNIPNATTCCNFLGQLIIGGLNGSAVPWNNLSNCSVAWSDIGSNEMNPEDYLVAGFAQMPWDENGNGEVWKVLPLGNTVRVYGDNGICNLLPISVGKTTGFGISELETPGILSSDSIAGDEFVHGYVDNNYDWNIIAGDKATNLGYRKKLKLLTNRILVRYDSHNKRFYISDGLLCYVYSKYGMYSTNQCVSSIGNYKGLLTGFFKDNADTKIRLKTTSFDLGHQSEQTVESIEFGLSYPTTSGNAVTGGLDMRYDFSDDFISLPYTYLNPRGIMTQKCTAREFKIRMQGEYEAGKDFSLSSLKAKIKFSDKRNIRGRVNVS